MGNTRGAVTRIAQHQDLGRDPAARSSLGGFLSLIMCVALQVHAIEGAAAVHLDLLRLLEVDVTEERSTR